MSYVGEAKREGLGDQLKVGPLQGELGDEILLKSCTVLMRLQR